LCRKDKLQEKDHDHEEDGNSKDDTCDSVSQLLGQTGLQADQRDGDEAGHQAEAALQDVEAHRRPKGSQDDTPLALSAQSEVEEEIVKYQMIYPLQLKTDFLSSFN